MPCHRKEHENTNHNTQTWPGEEGFPVSSRRKEPYYISIKGCETICRYCLLAFANASNLRRHIRETCLHQHLSATEANKVIVLDGGEGGRPPVNRLGKHPKGSLSPSYVPQSTKPSRHSSQRLPTNEPWSASRPYALPLTARERNKTPKAQLLESVYSDNISGANNTGSRVTTKRIPSALIKYASRIARKNAKTNHLSVESQKGELSNPRKSFLQDETPSTDRDRSQQESLTTLLSIDNRIPKPSTTQLVSASRSHVHFLQRNQPRLKLHPEPESEVTQCYAATKGRPSFENQENTTSSCRYEQNNYGADSFQVMDNFGRLSERHENHSKGQLDVLSFGATHDTYYDENTPLRPIVQCLL